MKIQIKAVLILAAAMSAFVPSLFAQLNIPSDGSDGDLVISNDTVIDLGQAVTGNWDDNNTAHAGNGIYDPTKWAVVFKYSSVFIANGATLTFSNHPTHAPVVWLVSGNVTNNGTISLDGHSISLNTTEPAEPGPGGFRGATTYMYGFGPGGGYSQVGFYSTGNPYGNEQIVPLIGGSGGWSSYTYNGGGGGGAILIAASGTIAISGMVSANGFQGGSGGGIRLVAGQLIGNGNISAYGNYTGDPGRIRLEAISSPGINLSLNPNQYGNSLAAIVSPFPLTIWPATNAPTVQVMTISNSVANLTAPTDPKASLAAGGDDLGIATTAAVTIGLQTSNFPTNGTVNVYIKSLTAGQTVLQASLVSGDSNSANWQVVTSSRLPVNHTVIQARAVLP
jgi:hypothetical protein